MVLAVGIGAFGAILTAAWEDVLEAGPHPSHRASSRCLESAALAQSSASIRIGNSRTRRPVAWNAEIAMVQAADFGKLHDPRRRQDQFGKTSGTPLGPQERRKFVSLRRGVGTVILFGAFALGGCASAIDGQPASPAFTPQAECARNGGWWRHSMNFCEYR
jgi:hypothetical protein